MNSKDLKTISKLAKISMTDAEMHDLEADILKIQAMADELADLDLEIVKPVADLSLGVLRSDAPESCQSAKELVALAPTNDGEYITVPTKEKE